MMRELLSQGVVKEYHRSLSSDSRLRERSDRSRDSSVERMATPRHLMAGARNLNSGARDNWMYILLTVLLLSLAASLVLHMRSSYNQPSSRLLAGDQCTDQHQKLKVNANTIAVQAAYLAATVVELQEKIGVAKLLQNYKLKKKKKKKNGNADPSSPSEDAMADLILERKRNGALVTEVASGLDGMASLLMELKEAGVDFTKTSTGKDAFAKLVKMNAGRNDDDVDQEKLLLIADKEALSLGIPAYDIFDREEIRKYIKVRQNRSGKKNFMGTNFTSGAIGHSCVRNKALLEKYMDYDVGEYCRDDWVTAQQLLIRGCEPLPRRRCRARGPKQYTKPLPANLSLWALPDNRNVRWDNYFCQNFSCLADYTKRKKFFKCSPCFDLAVHEKVRWMVVNSSDTEFLITDVLAIKPLEIRIGLDYSMGTGTFAARMKEHGVTIASTTLNLGAPFSETIALRGLIPLYVSLNQRLPFFDNTLDLVHTTLFLDGWIDHQLLDFILFDFDRVLRPGGLFWLDRFFCSKDDLAEYLFYFKRLRYKVHMWRTLPKTDQGANQVYFSAVWEKPRSPF